MVSLGCAKNQVDAEVMLGLLSQNGYKIVNESAEADIILVNTCGFIGSAKEESINAILEQAQYKKTGRCKALIVTGCLGERYKDELMQEIPEIDAVVGTGNYTKIVDVLNEITAGKHGSYYGNIDMPMGEVLPRIISTNGPTAYLKIAEGCDNYCTYCIIPQLRGKFRSKPISSVIQEATDLVNKGIREFIIIAQDITRYGQESKGSFNLVSLLKELCKIPDLKWIRLMYCYPDRITEELINLIAQEDKICCYMDIPIQHINQQILLKMNRASGSNNIRILLKTIRERIPQIIIRTSLIVGFPGEGEEEFNELVSFVQEGYFNHIGVFPYSQEEGTKAAAFINQVDDVIKEERRNQIMSVQKKVSKRLNKAKVGQIFEVLIEGLESKDLYYGRSYGEAPGIDGLVYVYSVEPLKVGDFVDTIITKSYEYDLLGEVYESGE